MIFSPKSYQRTAVTWVLNRLLVDGKAGAGLLLDPGLGKTSITLTVIRTLQMFAGLRRVLIVAPLRVVYSVWPLERNKWDQFAAMRVSVIHGTEEERIAALNADAEIYLINADGIRWLVKYLLCHQLLQLPAKNVQSSLTKMGLRAERERFQAGESLSEILGEIAPKRYATIIGHCGLSLPFFDMLIADESSLFKSCSAQRTQSLVVLARQTRWRMILTGTPIPRSLEDIFSQVFVLDEGEALGSSITKFRGRYFERLADFRGWIPRDNTCIEAIQTAIAPLCLRMDADTHLDLPAITYNNIWVDLGSAATATYKQLERELFIEFDQGSQILFDNAGSVYNACRGVANGGFYTYAKVADGVGKGTRRTHQVHDQKTVALIDLVGELQGKPLLVAYQFQHDVERILTGFKAAKRSRPAVISGNTSGAKSAQIMDDWNAGKVTVLLAQSGTISHGANLQFGGNDVAWYGLTNNLETYLQFNKRLHRMGVRGAVRIHHLLSRNTVDEAVLDGLDRKEVTQTAFLDAIKRYRNGYRISQPIAA